MPIADVISVARAQIGKPYVFGSTGPNSFDCSGLVVYAAWHGDHKRLPHFTGTLIGVGTEVSKNELQPGDLVFPDSHHVQIYTGSGMVVEAPHSGTNVREVKMWGFWRARRVFSGPAGSVGPPGSGSFVPVDNPVIPDSIEKLAAYLGDPARWRRLGMYIAGVILLLVGIVLMAGRKIL